MYALKKKYQFEKEFAMEGGKPYKYWMEVSNTDTNFEKKTKEDTNIEKNEGF